jgi:hypothetical protein
MTAANLNTLAEGFVQVVSTPPTQVAEHEMLIEWSRRSTEKNPVKDSERYRAIVIPRSLLKVADDAASSKYIRLLQTTIHDLAQSKFVESIKENMLSTSFDSSQLTLDLVLAYWAEERQRQMMDADKITAFLKASKTIAGMSESVAKVWMSKIPKICAPSYKMLFSKGQAATIVSKLHDDDMMHPAAVFIATRCNAILSATEVTEEL